VKRERKKRPGDGGITLLTEFDQASTMAYLHGDVADDEFEAACDYEFARESRVLRATAGMGIAKQLSGLSVEQWRAEFQKTIKKLEEEEGKGTQSEKRVRPWDNERNRGDVLAPLTAEDQAALLRKGRQLGFEEICQRIDETFSCGGLFLASPWLEILSCPNFPEKPWNSLSAEDRARILRAFPLPFGKRQLRSVDRAALERLQTAERLTAGQRSPVLFAFNWAKAKKQQCHEFAAWLDRPENKERLAKYRNRHTGKTGGHADRLKDLAAWRLFEHCDGDWSKANEFANEHRKLFEKPDAIVVVSGKKHRKIIFKEGEPRPFHDPRQGQGKQQINAASLYSEESGFLKARGRARAYLEQRMPWEFFRKAAEEELEKMRERIKRLSEAFSQGTGEISKEASLLQASFRH